MENLFYATIDTLYNSKRHEFLGRDGARWAKLASFYGLFYLGLGGYFCFLLSVFMISLPKDEPRYYEMASCMKMPRGKLVPGLGYRPQRTIDGAPIVIDMNDEKNQWNPHAESLHQYLSVYYWRDDKGRVGQTNKFTISNPGDCTAENQYGFSSGKPCILLKMNKIVGFVPKPIPASSNDKDFKAAGCRSNPNAIAIHCFPLNPTTAKDIGNITYISENGQDQHCGSIETKWFPYKGKKERRDVYQAPYVWVQFRELKPNVLVTIACRLFAENIDYKNTFEKSAANFKLKVTDTRQVADVKPNDDI